MMLINTRYDPGEIKNASVYRISALAGKGNPKISERYNQSKNDGSE